jgi:hypothetical protein
MPPTARILGILVVVRALVAPPAGALPAVARAQALVVDVVAALEAAQVVEREALIMTQMLHLPLGPTRLGLAPSLAAHRTQTA